MKTIYFLLTAIFLLLVGQIEIKAQCQLPQSNTGTSGCGAGTYTLQAITIYSNVTHRWYTTPTGGTPLSGVVTVYTGGFPSITQYTAYFSATTTLYVSTYNQSSNCESARVPVTFTLMTPATPSVTISSSPNFTGGDSNGPYLSICIGTSVIFTANPTNGGSAPAYQWYSNGSAISGQTGATYTSTTLSDGQLITVKMTSNASCISTSTATSYPVRMIVNPTVGTPCAITVASGSSEPTTQLTIGSNTTNYSTTASNSTGYNWSIDNASAGSINPTTGVMSWKDWFSGTVNIKVTANGCYGPSAQVTRSVTLAPVVNTALPVGATNGNFGVSPSGAATYQVPIMIPKGLSGLEPQVSIVYNSQTGNGLVGWGCNLTGLSAITRVPKNLYSNNTITGLTIDINDQFALDGNHLLLAPSETKAYGADGAAYRTENETFQHIVSNGSYNSTGPAGFMVYAKNGTIFKYGSNGGTALYSANGKNAILTWYLDYVEDVYGNTMSYTYTKSGMFTYLSKITYGTNKGGYGAASTVEFFYQTRPDVIKFHYPGAIGQIDQRLYRVVSKTSAQVLRTYDFTFTADAFSRLTKITESNGAGEQLNPTVLNWGDYKSSTINPSSFSLPTTDQYYSQVDFSQRFWTSGDVNGDGLTDLISFFSYKYYTNGGNSWTQVNVAQPFYASLSSDGTTTFSVGTPYEYLPNITWGGFKCYSSSSCVQNLNGDSTPDIVVPYFNKFASVCQFAFYVLNASTSSPLFFQDLLPTTDKMPVYAIDDLNNDGIDDIVYFENSKTNAFFQGKIHYGTSNPNWTNQPNNDWLTINTSLDQAPEKIFVADINGDGLKDLLIFNQKGYQILLNNGGSGALSFTDGGFYSNIKGWWAGNCIIKQGDFNGDGLVDFIFNNYSNAADNSVITNWYFAINNGNLGFDIKPLPLITASNDSRTEYDDDKDNCIIYDFDNDGKSDVIITDATYHDASGWLQDPYYRFTDFRVSWYKSTGDNVTLGKSTISYSETDALTKLYTIGDFNGDGRGDLMNVGYDCYGGVDTTQKWRMYSTPNTNYQGGMVTSITNGMAQRVNIGYTTTAAKTNYSKDASLPSGTPAFPLAFLGNTAYLVNRITANNGVSADVSTTYAYTNGVIDLQRGFLGFGKVTTTNTLSKAIAEQNYEFMATSGTTKYYQPFLTKTRALVDTKLLSETSTPVASYSITPLTNGQRHIFMYPSLTTQTDYLQNSVTTTNTTMDGNGNLVSTVTKTTDKDVTGTIVASQTTTYNGYAKRVKVNLNPYANAPDNVATDQTHKDTPGKFTVTTAFTYNDNGSLKTKTNFSGTTKSLTTSYTYDEVGNIRTTIAGNRTVTLEYTADKRFVKKQYNPLYNAQNPNQFTETAYDTWGYPVNQSDLNRLQTIIAYDNWNRVTSKTAPDGTKVVSSINWYDKGNATSYKPSNPGLLYYKVSVDEDNHFIGAEYFDAAGHTLRKASGSFDTRILFTDLSYNTFGKVSTVSDPYLSTGSTTRKTSYEYDTYLRENKVTGSDGVSITTAWSDDSYRKTTTTNSTGEVYTKQYDVAGLLITATDPGGSLGYTYYSTGKPATITPAGGAGVTTIEYWPETGKQKSLDDPDAGKSTYDYNNFGELISQTDGNNKTTTINYDLLGRNSVKTTGTLVTSYFYDATGALGLVDHITKSDGSGMAYTYDGLTRLKTETRSKGSDAFTYIYAYNTKSLVSSLTYPNNMVLTYGYNTTSNDLTSIIKDGTTIWSLGTTINDVNERGQIKKVTLGNGKATQYGYDTEYRLNSITAPNLVSFSYSFNSKQQLDYRDEYIYDGTAMKGFKESFIYDGVNRLLTATKSNGNTPLTMVYKTGVNDRIGSKSDAGTFGYNETTNHCIDQLTTASGYNPPRHDLTINDEGKTTLITETNNNVVNKTLTLDYGLDNERFKTEYTQDGARKYTRYYFDNYEKEVMADNTVRHLNYIYAGNTLFAIFEQKPGGDKMHYVYTDRQGSLKCITDATGNIEQRLSFDAWGNRRDYITGLKLSDTQLAAAIALTSRGYTGHEHVDGLALINMNARFYDPALGIFLSPDNYVQAPDNSQNFNRYTYCMNNPLMYTDPNGEMWQLVVMMILQQAMMSGMQSEMNGGNFWDGAFKGAAVGTFSALVTAGVGTSISGMSQLGQSAVMGGTAFVTTGVGSMVMNDGKWDLGGSLMAAGMAFGMTYASYRSPAEIDEIVVGSSKNENVTNANNYNSSSSANSNDDWLHTRMQDEFSVSEGDFKLQLITTRAGVGYGMTDKEGLYVNLKTKHLVAAYFDPTNGNADLHISPGITNADAVTFRAYAGHELIHAYHYFALPYVDTKFTERVAYKYTYDVFMSNGRISDAFSIINTANSISGGSWWGSYPAQYQIPSPYNFFSN